MSAPHPELDLDASIRPGLDILANEIVIAFKKRTRFPQNPPVYRPGLVRGRPETTLLDYELAQMERLHAELGRYAFASQEAFSDVSGVAPVIVRDVPPSPVSFMSSGVGPRVVEYYLEWVAQGCAPGSNPATFGETVTADVSALLAVMERVNLGKYVAESKIQAAPRSFMDTAGDRAAILSLIVKKDREAEVVAVARRLAEHYDFDPLQAERLFRWMITTTVDIEVDYVRLRLAQGL